MTAAPLPLHGKRRALLETLRAPLLLSPIADVSAGACLILHSPMSQASDVSGIVWAWVTASCTGVALLAAGMAHNALADIEEDRISKPSRPLPRGAVSRDAVLQAWRVLLVLGLVFASLTSGMTLLIALCIVLLSLSYHSFLKTWRVPGCLALGGARALSLLLGVVAVGNLDSPYTFSVVWNSAPQYVIPILPLSAIVIAYFAYIAGASLHASTDDSPISSPWSGVGVGICVTVLVALLAGALYLGFDQEALNPVHQASIWSPLTYLAGVVTLAWATLRILKARRRLSPPALTGILLSGMFLFGAAVCFLSNNNGSSPWALIIGVTVFLLFTGSRQIQKSYPPS